MALRLARLPLLSLAPLLALLAATPLPAQTSSTRSLGAGVSVPVATAGSPSFAVALAATRRRFGSIRTGVEAGYASLGNVTTRLTYTVGSATVSERLEARRALWYAGWVARAAVDRRRTEWLALTGVAHLRRHEQVNVASSTATARAEYGAHATGPLIALGVARPVRRTTLEARLSGAYAMNEGFVVLLTTTAWLAREPKP